MSLKINPLEAKDWDKEELDRNVAYFESRSNWDALRLIEQTLGKQVIETPTDATPEPEGVNETADIPFDELSKDELKAIAEERGLPVSGTKDELIERITEAADEEAEEE